MSVINILEQDGPNIKRIEADGRQFLSLEEAADVIRIPEDAMKELIDDGSIRGCYFNIMDGKHYVPLKTVQDLKQIKCKLY